MPDHDEKYEDTVRSGFRKELDGIGFLPQPFLAKMARQARRCQRRQRFGAALASLGVVSLGAVAAFHAVSTDPTRDNLSSTPAASGTRNCAAELPAKQALNKGFTARRTQVCSYTQGGRYMGHMMVLTGDPLKEALAAASEQVEPADRVCPLNSSYLLLVSRQSSQGEINNVIVNLGGCVSIELPKARVLYLQPKAVTRLTGVAAHLPGQ